MQRYKLLSMLVAAAFPLAATAMPRPFIGPANDAVKQADVQSAAVYPQEGATSGIKADKLEAKGNTPPVLATTQQRLAAVEGAAVYPQEGRTSGRKADRLASEPHQPAPRLTHRQLTELTVTHAGA
jgi:hypothetical protein